MFDRQLGTSDHQISRWLVLRGLGLIYLSAFFSLVIEIRGLIGPRGILPAGEYLGDVARNLGALRFWFAPTLLWISSGSYAVMGICVAGLLASLLLIFNLWPRPALIVCFGCFLSFVAAAQDFSGYQSDGMLLEAGFLAIFLAPSGLLPGWGRRRLPVRASIFLLLWECFRIYFESGVVKLASGDPTWRNFTAMDEYYQNGPLPTWIGWYLQHLPHGFHAITVVLTLGMELVLVWAMFLPRRWRIACFFMLTTWQAGVILTANYTFLNYLVLLLGFLLLDDRYLIRFVPLRFRKRLAPEPGPALTAERHSLQGTLGGISTAATAVMLLWIFYATLVPMVRMLWRNSPLPNGPAAALDPFRIANEYGLFAVMTPHRYEIEFQGSNDGTTWVAYPFRFKPQDIRSAPGIYAPYQPRFEWNLWFASLGAWRQYPIVPRTEEALLQNDPDVLRLFARNPFAAAPPKQVRAVLWQYWFSSMEERRRNGVWWRRQMLGTYAPTIELRPDGRFVITEGATLGSGAAE